MSKKILLFFFLILIGCCLLTPVRLPSKQEKDIRYKIIYKRIRYKKRKVNSKRRWISFKNIHAAKHVSTNKQSGIAKKKIGENSSKGVGSYKNNNNSIILKPRTKSKLYKYKTKTGKIVFTNYYPGKAKSIKQ